LRRLPAVPEWATSAMLTTALILLVSGVLIGAGISLIWRDARGRKRRAFVSERDARVGANPEVEITISYDTKTRASEAAAAKVSEPEPPPAAPKPQRPMLQRPGPLQEDARVPVEQEWAALQPAIAAGMERVNAVIAPARLSVGASGEASWSYKNRGYGSYRRVLLSGESIAWLRIELSADGRLGAALKAHKEELTEINAANDAAAQGLTAAGAGDLLSQCVARAAGYAVRQQSGRDSDEEASRKAWESVDALVLAALKATNGALAQAGAQLIPLAPAAWEAELRRHRMTLAVEVNGGDIARMHIERHTHEMEVAVGVREPHLIDLGRRRRVPIEGMTIHALAELIASCAWPAIARFKDIRPTA
jgi:hypothetical protein